MESIIERVGAVPAGAPDRPRRPGARPLRRARALDRGPAGVGGGGAQHARAAARPLRGPHADAGPDPRGRSRGAARRRRAVALEGRVPARPRRARSTPATLALEELDELPDEEVAERLMQVTRHRAVDGRHVPDLPPRPARRAAGRGPRPAARGDARLRPAQAARAPAPDTAGPPLAPVALGRHLVPVGLAARRSRRSRSADLSGRQFGASHRPERERPRRVETTVP